MRCLPRWLVEISPLERSLSQATSQAITLQDLLTELKTCSYSRNFERGKDLHKAAIQAGYNSNVFVANTLINMYGKCGHMDEALRVFEKMKSPTVVSWNALILGYADNGEANIALDLFLRMRSEGYHPDERSFISALKACTELGVGHENLRRGKSLHLLASRQGCSSDIYVEGTLVDMYAKLKSIEDARKVFDMMQYCDAVSWNALIMGYAENGKGEMALLLFAKMKTEGCIPDTITFIGAVMACADLNELGISKIRSICLLASSKGSDSNIFLNNTLMDAYAKCGSMCDAVTVFKRMRVRDAVSWNALILGYAENGDADKALDLFSEMVHERCFPDARTFLAALKACSDLVDVNGKRALERGKPVHLLASCHHCDTCIYVESVLVDMYAKSGSMEEARNIFNRMSYRDVVSWNALILGYAVNGEGELSLQLFSRLEGQGWSPNEITFVAALKACSDIADKEEGNENLVKIGGSKRGKALHCLVSRYGCDSNMYVENTLVDMYWKCGTMHEARRVFDRMLYHDTVSWNSLILGYAENGEVQTALDLFWRLELEGSAPDKRTFVAVLKACTDLALKEQGNDIQKVCEMGKRIHSLASYHQCDSDIYVENALVGMYSKCWSMEDARLVFENMQERDVVSWTVLMLGYVETGQGRLVLNLFSRMKQEGCEPDPLTFVAALKACGMLAALEIGKIIHSEICTRGFDGFLAYFLVDFYAKCGSLNYAEQVFDLIPTRDLATWNALIAGYCNHGDYIGVFNLFDKLLNACLQPDWITLLIVLTTCSHAGLLAKANHHFEAMYTKYGIIPNFEHYACMVDILGRANKLDDAMVLLRNMPVNPISSTWMTILAACRKWENVELGRLAFQSLTCLDDKSGGAYALMANLAPIQISGRWHDEP